MKKLLLFLLITTLTISLSAQAELVHEFIPGTDGTSIITSFGGTYNQEVSVKLNDNQIVFMAKGEFGRELYKIENGAVSLIADLKTGIEDSSPKFLTVFEGLIYFLAEGDQGARIYSTDGTEGGTQIAFDLGDEDTKTYEYTVFLVGRDGRLYFEFDGSIYSYSNGELLKTDDSNPIGVGSVSNANDYGWSLYKDGIAVFDLIDGQIVLVSINGNVVEELAQVPYDGSFDDRFAMEAFEGGIFFAIESFDDTVEGDYVYKESTGEVKKIGVGGRYYRSEYLGDDECIISGYNNATYVFNAANPEGKEINDDQAFTYAGGGWEREHIADGLLYTGAGGTFDDTEIFFIEKNSSSATLLHTTDNVSFMKTDGSFTFYFGESELGDSFDDEDLFAFNHTTKDISPIKTLFDAPFNTDITPLGVIDQDLYFFGKLDNTIGVELYKIDIGFVTSTEDKEFSDHIELANLGNNQFKIEFDSNKEINIDIYSIDGRLLEQINAFPNTAFEVKSKGMILMTAVGEKLKKTFKVVNY